MTEIFEPKDKAMVPFRVPTVKETARVRRSSDGVPVRRGKGKGRRIRDGADIHMNLMAPRSASGGLPIPCVHLVPLDNGPGCPALADPAGARAMGEMEGEGTAVRSRGGSGP